MHRFEGGRLQVLTRTGEDLIGLTVKYRLRTLDNVYNGSIQHDSGNDIHG